MNNIIDNPKAQHFIKNLSGKTKFIISKNAREIGLSRQTYQNKLDNLREQKIIKNFTININPNILPTNLKYVMIEIKTNPKEPDLVKELLDIIQLRMLDGIIGDFSLFALLVFKSSEEYYQVLNKIDEIMAKSYFKKYQIIETIKVFKTNGISLRKAKFTLEELLLDKIINELKEKERNEIDDIEIESQEKIDLNQIAQKNPNVKYNPRKFPGLVIEIENSAIKILVFPNGKIAISGIKNPPESEIVIDQIIRTIRKTGINLDNNSFDKNFEIDNIDYMIMNILREDQGLKPISTYEIRDIFKKRHHEEISQSTIHNRIKKLEQNGIILNYTVNFKPKEIGFKGKYLLRIKPKDPSKYNELALRLERNKNITDLFRIGEQYGLFAIIRVKEIEDYATFIRNLYISEEIEDTYTNFVLDELIPYSNFLIF